MENKKNLEFFGGIVSAFIPLTVFLISCILYFVVFKTFEMYALAMGAFAGLMIGALFAKKYDDFWKSVCAGIADEVAISIVLILFVIGMFSEMIKACNVSGGFVWLADSMGIRGGAFTAFTFISLCVIATATGSSIGTMFTAFPIFYPAGVLLGCNPAVLAGAILSGAIFGDNLAPISDTTIMSASTQEYKKGGTADIGGVVSSRLKYSLVAGIIATVLFFIFGGGHSIGEGASEMLEASMNSKSLIMLVPVVIMLLVSVRTRSIYKAITAGLILGSAAGLIFGLITPADIANVADGAPGGFLVKGVFNMMGTVTLVISVFGIMGVLRSAGAFDMIIKAILNSGAGKSARGTELISAAGICITTLLFGGVTSAAIITFGPILNQVGKEKDIHPYRRANLLDGFANSIPVCVPFLSVFVYIGALLVQGYEFVKPLNAAEIASGMFYPMCLFVVLLVSVFIGWGRTYEGENGEQLKKKVTK